MKHICDCGQVYSTVNGVMDCQNAQHSAAAANELADALDLLQELGIDDAHLPLH
jgi:hypothetical protein